MPEGVALASGEVVSGPAYDDPASKPGENFTWDRAERRWREKKKPGRKVDPAAPPPAAASNPDRDGMDPDPAWMRDEPAKAKKRTAVGEVSRETQNDIASLAGIVGLPVLTFLKTVDPYCGGILADSFESVIDAAMPLICRSERIVSLFTEDAADWILWAKLGMALAPVARAVAEHHVLRTVQVVRDEHGHVAVVRRAKGEPDLGSHLVPPVVPDFSEYAA